MEDIQLKIAAVVMDWRHKSVSALVIADKILATPEIADALKLTVAKPLGHSIGTNKRDPV